MDTSEQYIKMCDCPEIQDKWEQSQAGDFYFMRDSLFHPTKITGNYNGDGWKLLPRTTNYGWLPRQDQIQELVFGKFDNPIYKAELFVAFHRTWLWVDFTSMEQLWLTYYMFQKHEKVWNGEEWEKKTIVGSIKKIREAVKWRNNDKRY